MGFKSIFRRLSVRFTIWAIVLIAIPVAIALGILERKLKDDFRTAMLHKFDKELEAKADKAKTFLEVAKGEIEANVIDFIEESGRVDGLVGGFTDGVPNATFFNSKLFSVLVKDIKVTMWKSRFYLQLRIIDAAGREIIRFDRTDFGPVRVSADKLQDKSSREYFHFIMNDPKNRIHVTPVTLNRERGKITLPHTPMLRVGKKIVLEDGRLLGILVLNLNTDMVLGSNLSETDTGFLVIDDHGTYLRHWDESVLFGSDLGHDANLLAEVPELKLNLQKQAIKIHYDPELKEFRVWQKVYFDEHDKSQYWVLMERHSESSILSPWVAAVEKGTASLLFIIIIGFTSYVLLAHYTLTPLHDLANAIKEMGKGKLSAHVNADQKTEIGDIGAAFNSMAERLEQTDWELRRAMALASSISKTAPNSHIVADQNGKILTVNPVTEKMFGYDSSELLGKNVSVLADSPHRENHDQYIKNYLESGQKKIIGITRELVALKKNGELFPVNLHINETEVDGEIIFVAIIEDITERKRAEEALLLAMQKLTKANAEIRDFANIVSHDLRSPLVNLKGFAGELKEAFRDIQKILKQASPGLTKEQRGRIDELFQDEIPEAFGFIDSSSSVMERLVSSIMALARIGVRKMILAEVDTAGLIDEKLKSMQHQMEEKNVEVKVNFLPSVVADLMSLDQIFGNILLNAVKYLDPGRRGVIDISGERRFGDTLFKVTDNGIGIPDYGKDKVFALFRRVVGKDIPGEGIGLAFVKALVERHEGEIWFESQEGMGTTFFFTIPDNIKTLGDGDG